MKLERRLFGRHALGAAAALGTLALGGCIVAPPRDVRYGGAPGAPVDDGGVYVEVPPPAPLPEVVGIAPFLGAVWIAGYWGWLGGRYNWVPGRWASPPGPGYFWNPYRWVPSGRGWRGHGGGWGRRR